MILAAEIYAMDLECMKWEIEAFVLAKGFYNSQEGSSKEASFSRL
jgi:hypothetical protein